MNDSKRSSIHLNWSDLVQVDIESEYRQVYSNRRRPDARACTTTSSAATAAKAAAVPSSSLATQKTIKNIVLVLFTPKPKNWGSWWVKQLQLASRIVVTPNSVHGRTKFQKTGGREDRTRLSTQHPLLFTSTSTRILRG